MPTPIEKCPYCEKPVATEEQWKLMSEGDGAWLCWGDCCTAEDALKRVKRERDVVLSDLLEMVEAEGGKET